jgi:hypothetical protein
MTRCRLVPLGNNSPKLRLFLVLIVKYLQTDIAPDAVWISGPRPIDVRNVELSWLFQRPLPSSNQTPHCIR